MTLWERRDLPVLQALATTEDEHVRDGHLWLSDEDAGRHALGWMGVMPKGHEEAVGGPIPRRTGEPLTVAQLAQ